MLLWLYLAWVRFFFCFRAVFVRLVFFFAALLVVGCAFFVALLLVLLCWFWCFFWFVLVAFLLFVVFVLFSVFVLALFFVFCSCSSFCFCFPFVFVVGVLFLFVACLFLRLFLLFGFCFCALVFCAGCSLFCCCCFCFCFALACSFLRFVFCALSLFSFAFVLCVRFVSLCCSPSLVAPFLRCCWAVVLVWRCFGSLVGCRSRRFGVSVSSFFLCSVFAVRAVARVRRALFFFPAAAAGVRCFGLGCSLRGPRCSSSRRGFAPFLLLPPGLLFSRSPGAARPAAPRRLVFFAVVFSSSCPSSPSPLRAPAPRLARLCFSFSLLPFSSLPRRPLPLFLFPSSSPSALPPFPSLPLFRSARQASPPSRWHSSCLDTTDRTGRATLVGVRGRAVTCGLAGTC